MSNLRKSLISLCLFGLALPILGSVLSVTALEGWRFDGHVIHGILEVTGTIIAGLLFLFFYLNKNLQEHFGRHEIIWISSAVISMGLLDGFHAIAPVGNNFVWLHSIATFFGGALFAGLWLQKGESTLIDKIPFIALIVAIIIGVVSFAVPNSTPTMLENGEFTLLARLLNIIGGIGFIAATIYCFKKYIVSNDKNYHLLSAHCLLFGAAGILFELSSLWDAAWWWWHILRLVAYIILIFFFAGTIVKQASNITTINFRPLYLKRFLAAIVTFIAGVVIIGWHTGNTAYIQINPNFAPMQYNTALGFLLSGLAIFAINNIKLPINKICAIAVLSLGGLTLTEYIFNINIGIDQLFMEDYVGTKVTHPGRMSPVTALCFTITGAAIILSKRKIILFSLSITLFSLATIALLAYAVEVDGMYGIASLTRMAIHTTLGFLMTSIILITLGLRDRSASFDIWASSPVICAIVLMTVTLLAWQSSREFTMQANKTHFKNIVDDKISAIEKRFSLYRQALLGGVGLIKASKHVSREEWKKYADSIDPTTNLPGTNGIGYIDYVDENDLDEFLSVTRKDEFPDFVNKPKTEYPDKYIIKYIEPVELNLPAVGLDVGFEKHRREGVLRARDTGKTSLTKIIFLVQDNEKKAGFLLLSPVYKKGAKTDTVEQRRDAFIGMAYSPFMGRKFMADINDMSSKQMNFTVYDGKKIDEERVIFKSENDSVYKEMPYLRTITNTEFAGQVWTIVWQPNKSFEPRIDLNTPNIILVTGIIISVIFSFLFHLLAKIYGNSAKTLEENRKRLDNIVNNAVDGLIVIDMTGIIELYNPACEKLFGYKSKEVMGQNIKMLMPDYYAITHDGYLSAYLKTDKKKIIGMSRELQAQHKNGAIIPIDLSISEMTIDGIKKFSGIIRDISERKKAEEEIAKTQKELESFIYIASHDLRSPLINLKGFTVKLTQHVDKLVSYLEAHISQLTKEEQADVKEIVEEKIPKASKFVQEGVSRIDNMTTAILNLSRTGRRDLTFQNIDTGEMLKSCRNVLDYQLKEKAAEIKLEDAPEIIGDSTSIEQIFGNLLDNALKYLAPDRKGMIKVQYEDNHSHHKFAIADNGRGIAEDDKEKVFAIFRRAGNVVEDTKGEGMGLNHTKALIERHGGKIWFESELGVGTTFFFTIDKNLELTKEVKNDE